MNEKCRLALADAAVTWISGAMNQVEGGETIVARLAKTMISQRSFGGLPTSWNGSQGDLTFLDDVIEYEHI